MESRSSEEGSVSLLRGGHGEVGQVERGEQLLPLQRGLESGFAAH